MSFPYQYLLHHLDCNLTCKMKPIAIRAPIIIQFLASMLLTFSSVNVCNMFISISMFAFTGCPDVFIIFFHILILHNDSILQINLVCNILWSTFSLSFTSWYLCVNYSCIKTKKCRITSDIFRIM